ncbi:MAG: hypothetical protein MI922_08235, partial [Bacteroidales bacterium]|nr:hypothetical protein [Bacteroidales bacterium]
YAFNLVLELKKTATNKGFKSIYGIYDPLEANLGKLYAFLNSRAIKYIKAPYNLDSESLPIDKVLFVCDLTEPNHNRLSNTKVIQKVETFDLSENAKEHIIEIPNNYLQLKSSHPKLALEWRRKTQLQFDDFINKKGFVIEDCRSLRINETKRTFYFLSKQKSKINE